MDRRRVLGFILLLATNAFAQKAPQELAEKLTLVQSSDAAGHLNKERLARVLWALVNEQKLEVKQVPNIIVLHVSPATGMAIGVPASGTARTDHCAATGKNYYQLWVLGEPKGADYVAGLETILQHELGLQPTDSELKPLLRRVLQADLATLDAPAQSDK